MGSQGRRSSKAEDPAQHQIKPTNTGYVCSVYAKLKFIEEGISIRLFCTVVHHALC